MNNEQMNNGEKIIDTGAKVTKVPPDGGWGYAVCLGYTLIMVAMGSHSNSFGLIFHDFLEEHGQSSSSLTTVLGVSAFLMAFQGLVLNVAYKKFAVRTIALVGAVFYTSGWFFNIFLTNVNQLLLTNGVLMGLGMGILLNTSLTTLNAYFMKRRVIAMAIVMSVTNLTSVLFPFVLEYMNNRMDFRSVMLIMTGLASHTIAGALLYQPAEWHLVEKIEYPEKEPEDDENGETGQKDDVESCTKPLNEDVSKIHKRKSFIETAEEDLLRMENPQTSEIQQDDKKQSLWSKISELMSLSIVKDSKFWLCCMAMSFAMFADLQFFAMQPFLLYEINLTTDEIAKCVSIMSLSLLAAKLVLIGVGKLVDINAIDLSICTFVITFVLRIIYLQQTSFLGFAVMNCLLAFPKSWYFVSMPLSWAELYPKDYASAFGFGFFVCGLVVGLLSPSAGIIRDYTGSYVTSYYYLTFLSVSSVVPFAFRYYITDRRKPKQEET